MAAKTKEDHVNQVAKKAGIIKEQARKAVDSLLDSVANGLQDDGKVTLTGFGSFQVQEREARKGRNPQTGEQITIPAKKVVKFSPGKGLKDSVSG